MAQFKRDRKIIFLSRLTSIHTFSEIRSHGGPPEGEGLRHSIQARLCVCVQCCQLGDFLVKFGGFPNPPATYFCQKRLTTNLTTCNGVIRDFSGVWRLTYCSAVNEPRVLPWAPLPSHSLRSRPGHFGVKGTGAWADKNGQWVNIVFIYILS